MVSWWEGGGVGWGQMVAGSSRSAALDLTCLVLAWLKWWGKPLRLSWPTTYLICKFSPQFPYKVDIRPCLNAFSTKELETSYGNPRHPHVALTVQMWCVFFLLLVQKNLSPFASILSYLHQRLNNG